MRLRQEIEISYEIKAEYNKRRGGVFSPRKGGGKTNLSSTNNNNNNNTYTNNNNNKQIKQENYNYERKDIPINNNSNNNNNNKFNNTNRTTNTNININVNTNTNTLITPRSPIGEKQKRPTTAPSQRPKSVDNYHRVRHAFQKSEEQPPWNNSTTAVDRDRSIIIQDNEISKYRQNAWGYSTPPKLLSPTTGPSHESDRKTLSTSYSRCRDARTSGPILNISTHYVGYAQQTMQRINENTNTGIHNIRWNVSTKDRDEEPRAKPNISIDQMSSEKLFDTFYSNDVLKEVSSRGIIKQNESKHQGINKTWDDVIKVNSTSKLQTSQKLVYR
mmetsp:Transcript_22401/g.23075  ORF Transcript_22401/g.23075 Transcript_22401/m.23075 type:complete len:330 (+) Transcript_22401:79-1068(+)